ncbi:MAG: phosphate ABC transporter permease PstA [Planctomycetes bacterium]|nr:phosphate ABC transporter permease PstA [Planctomycetota bacterium]
MLWLCGGSLAVCLLMVIGLLVLVFWQGIGTFWPHPVVQVRLADGSVRMGEVSRQNSFQPSTEQLAELTPEVRAQAETRLVDGWSSRRQFRTGNFDLTNHHYYWVPDYLVAEESNPEWAVLIERQTWGRFYGFPAELRIDGKAVATEPSAVMQRLQTELEPVLTRFHRIEAIRKVEIGGLAEREEDARLAARAAELRYGKDSPRHRAAVAEFEKVAADTSDQGARFDDEIRELQRENARYAVLLKTADGAEKELPLDAIVRIYAPNQLGFAGRVGVYLDRWREFLFDSPRNTNQEGGVWPAIFGTVLMTLIMSILVVPFGVLAALYMREYAKAGLVISAVRIAVNNLAGVPSIVFGVFGLGFFCYIIGGSIDSLFYPERLPTPTFGKGALIWASLTLALLTLPVVIVATEEALSAVPSSMREGSYACGASKWQTIQRIVLPRALPGIMTGMILAMARGAGEVAPLMLVGVVKSANELPLDGAAPFLHPSRSFMHLGFHIYDLGFQSQNSEAAKPTVYTTTLLLIAVITVLNVFAIWLRSRLRRRFVAAQF